MRPYVSWYFLFTARAPAEIYTLSLHDALPISIAGSFVRSGVIPRTAKVRVIRDGVEVYDGTLASLKRFKDDVREVREGFECGIGIENFNDVKVGDVIEAYKIEEVARSLVGS